MDKNSGELRRYVYDHIKDEEIFTLFSEIVKKRNRIVHSFRITSQKGEQILATKEKEITANISLTRIISEVS